MPPRRRRKSRAGRWVLGIVTGVLALLVAVVVLASLTAPSSRTEADAGSTPAFPIPKPDEQQTDALLAGLRRIDPGLDHERSIDRARNACWSLLQGGSRAQVVKSTQARFDGSVRVTRADAEAILKLIEAGGWCHKDSGER